MSGARARPGLKDCFEVDCRMRSDDVSCRVAVCRLRGVAVCKWHARGCACAVHFGVSEIRRQSTARQRAHAQPYS